MTASLSDRDYEFLVDRLHGLTLSRIAERHGVSRERARQVIAKCIWHLLRAERKWAAAEIAMAEMARRLRHGQIAKAGIEKLTIEDLDLSVRAYHCLESKGMRTVAQLCDLTADELLKYKNFGVVSLRELGTQLDRLGAPHRLRRRGDRPTSEEQGDESHERDS